MVGGGVDEDVVLVPGSTLHTDGLVDGTQVLQLTVADGNGWNIHTDCLRTNQRRLQNHSFHIHTALSLVTRHQR